MPFVGVDDRTRVTSSTSNRPVPVPAKVRYRFWLPAGTPVSGALTSAYVVQPPVLGTATCPSTGPVAEPVRNWMVPPGPPETTRARAEVTPVRSRPW
ncbi:hypothetical protein C5N14_25390 [Micromonospora sp. MW-13]|nr:hypothetical protein C5N14_25390 [Micromonospora sp. MW-13]